MDYTEELLKIGRDWLNANASPEVGLCNDRSCVRCRLSDVLDEIEKSAPKPTAHEDVATSASWKSIDADGNCSSGEIDLPPAPVKYFVACDPATPNDDSSWVVRGRIQDGHMYVDSIDDDVDVVVDFG